MEELEPTQSPTAKIDIIKGKYKTLYPATRFEGSNVIVVRQAETIADVFPDWMDRCELDTPFYVPFDLNMPVKIPRRVPMRASYKDDPPLSEIGKIVAQLVAREIETRHATPILAIYAAPTLACLQTAKEISTVLEQRPIRLNADLCPSRVGMEFWMSESQLAGIEINVDHEYQPMVEMTPCESVDGVAERLKHFLNEVATSEGNIIVVADSLATKVLSDSVNGVSRLSGMAVQNAYDIADTAFPACSTAVFHCQKGKEQVSLHPSEVSLRPMTAIGLTTAENKECDMDFQ